MCRLLAGQLSRHGFNESRQRSIPAYLSGWSMIRSPPFSM
ncbi:hypothetical protein HMPREF9582_02584 [Cutibacterium acnes HL060PA1]|nr:hypothetical protein HMPREF9603_01770 [Cutibacterium acnes HL001PA1]EFT24847.1 hypothetical protein HMPREF9577_02553 [Cutibacterium acnes HL110PA3]EFT65454.1 hypothetical protein HMPREF9582_02584 [Cutibacterium acnes HL060PA1]